tara:strand:+ start:160 stop:573 length:414 start_codon:yes stop_codon:yes gene_type:complete
MRWSDREDGIVRQMALKGHSARAIAARLPGRTRNAVIGRCNREAIPLGGGLSTPSQYVLKQMDAVIRAAGRCKRANNGCRNPVAEMIYRQDGDQCGYPGCSSNKIPHALHGLCHHHNRMRLDADMKRTGCKEVAVGW